MAADAAAAMGDDLRWAVTAAAFIVPRRHSDINSDSNECRQTFRGKNCEVVPVCAMKRPFELQISISLFS